MKTGKVLRWGLLVTAFGLLFFITVRVTGLFAYAQNQYTKFKIFSEIFKHVQLHYVDEVEPVELLDKAISGMLQDLDPHTQYMDSDASGNMDDRFQGYEGIGISFMMIDGKITIMDVMDDGPSKRIGLERGDKIVKIDGKSAVGITQDEVPKLLKGPRGTKVSIHVERPLWDEPKEMTIVRDKTYEESVPHYYMLDEQTGYVHIKRFASTTEREFETALQSLEQRGMRKLVLDLRDDTGGYLQAAVGVADRFLPGNRNVVYTKGRTATSEQQFNSSDNNTHPFYPMIVLINDGSASASEIVSGALQDWDRALIVGTTSFGKGLVQTPFRFADGSQLLLTTARYFTPSGRLIQRPYKGLSNEDYYKQAHNGDNQNVSQYPDSLIFRTHAGRPVYGGGGITPDFQVTQDTLDIAFRELLYRKIYPIANGNPHLEIGDRFKEEHPDFANRRDWFVAEYEIPDDLYMQWVQYVQKAQPENTADSLRITTEELLTHKDLLAHMLKKEIAHQYWGRTGEHLVGIKKDEQLSTALTYFPNAEGLMQNYAGFIGKN